jgi:hypothetical protein
VKFDDRSLKGGGGIDLAWGGIEEKARDNLGLGEFFDDGTKCLNLGCCIESALGGNFGSVFGNEADFCRLEAESEVEHCGSGSHFEVELFAALPTEAQDIIVLDVATVLAEMHSDGVRPSSETVAGQGYGIGFRHDTKNGDAVAGLPESGKVINIYTQSDHSNILS